MKLDRTLTRGKRGKYSLILERRVAVLENVLAGLNVVQSIETLRASGVIDESGVGDDGEFFVIRLRDPYAGDALAAYAAAATADDPEYAGEVAAMAARAGKNHPKCRRPD